ncbi:MAG: mechanosensitive ion channel family protein [Gemmatimonadota bacterium]|nr:mechanosensitive ion channel family protein [Gemmatimonadota bacterium]
MIDALYVAIRPASAAAVALVAGFVAHAILDRLMRRRGRGPGPTSVADVWTAEVRRPARIFLILLFALAALPAAGLASSIVPTVRRWTLVGLIASAAWLAIELAGIVQVLIERKYRTDVEDNLQARRVQTRVRLLRRIAGVAIVLLAGGLILTLFPPVREVGLSLFASAGVAGIVLGIAARPTLSSVIAGIQVAFSEPIRLDDVVIVEGEWGRIEEITMTYVVVRIWDDRRLVVPLSRFIDQPFENWTRRTADLLGTAYLHADYTVDVAAAREALGRILDETDLWDGRVSGLQVTGADARTVELRALMSAANASDAWNLRCHVREELLKALREEQPDALPRVRARLEPAADLEPAGGVRRTAPVS